MMKKFLIAATIVSAVVVQAHAGVVMNESSKCVLAPSSARTSWERLR
jgi:hypothetical protein